MLFILKKVRIIRKTSPKLVMFRSVGALGFEPRISCSQSKYVTVTPYPEIFFNFTLYFLKNNGKILKDEFF